LNELAPHGLKGLGLLGKRLARIHQQQAPGPHSLTTLKGLKIRSTRNPYHIQAFKLLGMNPSPMPIAELYTALETGTFDAQEHPDQRHLVVQVLRGAKAPDGQQPRVLTAGHRHEQGQVRQPACQLPDQVVVDCRA
jgi:hypothetical protein